MYLPVGPLKLPHAGSSGWRTPWIDSLHLAQGFHRETGASASTGIKYITSDEPRWTCSPESSIKVLSKSQDYSDMLTVGMCVLATQRQRPFFFMQCLSQHLCIVQVCLLQHTLLVWRLHIDPVSRMAFLKPVSLPQAGGSMSFEDWGASAETSFQVAKHVKTSIKAVTGTVSMRYISEKIDIISPADKSQQVT